MEIVMGAGWEPGFVGVMQDKASLDDVRGWRRRGFGIYMRRHPPDFEVRTVAYLVHLATGLGLGAFRSRTEAAYAASTVEELADWTSPLGPSDPGASLASRVMRAWHRAGFYCSGTFDEYGNLIWCWGAHVVPYGAGRA